MEINSFQFAKCNGMDKFCLVRWCVLTYFYHFSMNWVMHDHCYYLNYLNWLAHWRWRRWQCLQMTVVVVLLLPPPLPLLRQMLCARPTMNVDCLYYYCWTTMWMTFCSLMISMTVMMIWILWRLMLVCSVSSVRNHRIQVQR